VKLHSYSRPTEELSGYKTFVRPDTADNPKDIKPILPSPPWSRSKPSPPLGFGKPAPGNQNYKIPNKPGDDSPVPNPAPSTTVQRRPEVNSAVGRPGPPSAKKRQKDQRGQAKMYHRKYYQGHKSKIKHQMEVWYTKWKNKFNYKKDQQKRRKNPQQFERKPGGGVKENKNRAEQDRKKTAEMIYLPTASLYSIRTGQYGLMLGAEPDTGYIMIYFDNHEIREVPFDIFLNDYVMLSEEDIEIALDNLDAAFGIDEEAEALERVVAKYADFLYEKRPPQMDPDTTYDRGSERQKNDDSPIPGRMPNYYIRDNPGSAKVIPENKDFVNNKAAIKVASRISDIRDACSSELRAKAGGVSIRLAKADARNALWLFDATGFGGKKYRIRIKAVPKGNVRDMNKVDILVSCTCPYWQWQGPEYYAQQEGYLFGKPRGTASKPDVKDPNGHHKACKHILACLDKVAGYKVPKKPGKIKKLASALQYLANLISQGEVAVVSSNQMELELLLHRYSLKKAFEGENHANL